MSFVASVPLTTYNSDDTINLSATTGTFTEPALAPLSVMSTAVVANLNASLLNGNTAAFYTNATNLTGTLVTTINTGANSIATTGTLSGGALTACSATINGALSATRLTSTETTLAPLSVMSTAIVANLNASLLNGNTAAFYTNATNLTGTLVTTINTGANSIATTGTLSGGALTACSATINGALSATRLTSTETTLAPLSVMSTAIVANLNASLLNGNTAAFYTNATNLTGTLVTTINTGANSIATTGTLSGGALTACSATINGTLTATNMTASAFNGNLDTIKAPGLYHYDGVGASVLGTNPNGSWNIRTIEIGALNRYSQFAMPYDIDRIFYRRHFNSWQSWCEIPVLQNGNVSLAANLTVSGDIYMANTKALVWPHVANVADTGPMVEKRYVNSDDRYGIGQFSGGILRMYAANARTVALGFATGASSYADVLTVTQTGSTFTGALTTTASITACSATINGALSATRLTSTEPTVAPLSVMSTAIVANLNASLLNGNTGAFYTNATNLTGTLVTTINTGANSIATTGTLSGGALTACSATINGSLSAQTANVSGTLRANAITANAANINGTVNATALVSTTSVTACSATINGALTVDTTASFGDGAVAAPSIAHKGDSDTGIWFPTADTIAFSTAGYETMRTTPSGHLGINTIPSPWFPTVRAIQIGSGASIWSWDGSNGGVVLASNMYDVGGGTKKYIKSAPAAIFDISNGAFSWFTADSGTANANIAFVNRMTLSSAGALTACSATINGALSATRLTSTEPTVAPLSVMSTAIVANLNASLLNGNTGAFYTNATNLTGTLVTTINTGANSIATTGTLSGGALTACSATINGRLTFPTANTATAMTGTGEGIVFTAGDGYWGPLIQRTGGGNNQVLTRHGVGVYGNPPTMRMFAGTDNPGSTDGWSTNNTRVALSFVLGNLTFLDGLVVKRATETSTTTANVGINTTMPTEALHVVGNALITGDINAATTTVEDGAIQSTDRLTGSALPQGVVRRDFADPAVPVRAPPTTLQGMRDHFLATNLSFQQSVITHLTDAVLQVGDYKCYEYLGYLNCPTQGIYEFRVNSDDASHVFVDGKRVAHWYGTHGMGTAGFVDGSAILTPGMHRIVAQLVQGYGGVGLSVLWKQPGDATFSAIPAASVRYDPKDLSYSGLSALTGLYTSGSTQLEMKANGVTVMTASSSTMQITGDITMANTKAIVWPHATGVSNPGVMLEKRYATGNDRYGIGQFAGGITRVYAAQNQTVAVGVASGAGTYTDVLTVKESGSSFSGSLFATTLTTTTLSACTTTITGTLTTTGNMGVMTAVPLDAFHVTGDVSISTGKINMRDTTTTGAGGVQFSVSTYEGPLVEKRIELGGGGGVANRYGIMTHQTTTRMYAPNVSTANIALGFATGEFTFNDAMVVRRVGLTANVGINTSNPLDALHVIGNIRTSGEVIITDGSTSGGNGILYTSSAYVGGLVEKRVSATDRYGLAVGAIATRVIASSVNGGAFIALGFPTSELGFNDNLVIKRRNLDSSSTTANVGINTSNPLDALHVVGNVRVDGAITASGDVTAFSDKRLKANLSVVTSSLDKLGTLTGYTFDRTDMPGHRYAGLVAQEVQAVLPEAVAVNSEGILAVSATGVLALLVEAVKSLTAKVDRLEKLS